MKLKLLYFWILLLIVLLACGDLSSNGENIVDESHDGDVTKDKKSEFTPELEATSQTESDMFHGYKRYKIDCDFANEIPLPEIDPFDICSVVEWSVYAIENQKYDAWYSIMYPYYFEIYTEQNKSLEWKFNETVDRFIHNIDHDEGYSNSPLIVKPSSWECEFWEMGTASNGFTNGEIFFRGESQEGDQLLLMITIRKMDQARFDEGWGYPGAEKWLNVYVVPAVQGHSLKYDISELEIWKKTSIENSCPP